jgi:prevent-host-death family protein
MVKQVNLYEAKTQLSRLVEEAAAGQVVIIAKNGKAKARLHSVADQPASSGVAEWANQLEPQARHYLASARFVQDWKEIDRQPDQANAAWRMAHTLRTIFAAALGLPQPGPQIATPTPPSVPADLSVGSVSPLIAESGVNE